MRTLLFAAILAPLLTSTQSASTLQPDPPIQCDSCTGWNAPRTPYRVFGNTFYVGTGGLGAVLIASDAGHILLDGGLPQSAPLIDDSIRAMGFRLTDVRLIVNPHAHYDHRKSSCPSVRRPHRGASELRHRQNVPHVRGRLHEASGRTDHGGAAMNSFRLVLRRLRAAPGFTVAVVAVLVSAAACAVPAWRAASVEPAIALRSD